MQAREELIESVCQKEVGVYQQIFSTTGMSLLTPLKFFSSAPIILAHLSVCPSINNRMSLSRNQCHQQQRCSSSEITYFHFLMETKKVAPYHCRRDSAD